MYLTPYTTLTWAYQLHYYLCFRTHRRKQIFTSTDVQNKLAGLISEIATNHDYHLLDHHTYPNQLRCMLSLRPSHAVAKVVQILKCNSARELSFSIPLWASGYAARSTGRADHLHMIVRIVPKVSIEEVALRLMNNGQYFIGRRYPELLIVNGMDQLWNASAYAGTCGDLTTGLIMKWLGSDK
jgi:REP element-mobilizing transposase RayT